MRQHAGRLNHRTEMSTNTLPELLPRDALRLIELPPTLASMEVYAQTCRLWNVFMGHGNGYDLLLPTDEERSRFLDGFKHRDASDIHYVAYSGEQIVAIDRGYQEAFDQTRRLCSHVGDWWNSAFFAYGGRIDGADTLMFLNPHVSLPERRLIEDLSNPREGIGNSKTVWYLLLLTARHELGHLYLKVCDWYRSMLDRHDAGPCLTSEDLAGLSERTQMVRVWSTGVGWGDLTGYRADAPRELTLPTGSLPQLYREFCDWYHRVYTATTEAQRCLDCPRLLMGDTGPTNNLSRK